MQLILMILGLSLSFQQDMPMCEEEEEKFLWISQTPSKRTAASLTFSGWHSGAVWEPWSSCVVSRVWSRWRASRACLGSSLGCGLRRALGYGWVFLHQACTYGGLSCGTSVKRKEVNNRYIEYDGNRCSWRQVRASSKLGLGPSNFW